jgi:hypothetical protein
MRSWAFTEPPDQIKKEINSIKANEAKAAVKDARPIQFRENIAMVLK